MQLDGLNEEVLDDIWVSSTYRHVGKGISNDQIVLADLFFKDLKGVLILFDKFE